jgi:hypothetical protein
MSSIFDKIWNRNWEKASQEGEWPGGRPEVGKLVVQDGMTKGTVAWLEAGMAGDNQAEAPRPQL